MADRRFADLHVHTTASDGTLSPAQVVAAADNAGLAAVAISDHDTIKGIPAAIEAGKDYDIVVVPGIEINTDYGKSEVHILGYYIDYRSESLLGHLQELRSARSDRALKMVKRLNDVGVKIDFERVRELAGGAIGRPHIARAIVEAGYVGSLNAAFGKYLVRGAPTYVPRYKLTPEEAIDIVKQAGGVPVLAHPGLNHHEELIPTLAKAGLKGLEAYHSDHTVAQTKHFVKLADRYDLIVTGGSDSHGPENVKTVEIGNATVDISAVYQLQEAARSSASSP